MQRNGAYIAASLAVGRCREHPRRVNLLNEIDPWLNRRARRPRKEAPAA